MMIRNLFCLAVSCHLLLTACNDKYKSIVESAPKPALSFSNDTLRLREKDYTNINYSNNGKISLYFASGSHMLNLQFSDTSGKVHFLYRGTEVTSGQPLVVTDSLNLFCTADSAGIYPVDFYLTDQLGKTFSKTLIVKCAANQRPKAEFFYYLLDGSQSQSWLYRLDGSLTSDADGIITQYHYGVNGQQIRTNNRLLEYTFHAVGIHEVSLYVTDDLGLHSDTLHKQINIK
jgi:hypothetical protein